MSATGLILVLWSLAHVHVEQNKRQLDDAREFFAAQFPEDAAVICGDVVGDGSEVVS